MSAHSRQAKARATPGPWVVSNEVGVSASPKGLLAFADTDLHSKPEAVANARLIAAAPDLLEALEALVNYSPDDEMFFNGRRGNGALLSRQAKARVAIARARGDK